MKYALKNAVILDGTKDMEPLRGQSVLVEGETIVGLVPAGSEPMGFEPVDLTGKSVLPLRFTMSHDTAVRAESYRAAASAVEAELLQGRDVAMVNLGDVALFATAYYIFAEIERDGFPARMLPGVTSVAAVADRLGQSLTEMEQPLHILPARCDLDAALALPGTKVLMKSGSAIHETVAALGRAGLLNRASMVSDCGLPSEQVFRDLREIPENVSYFATILVRSE